MSEPPTGAPTGDPAGAPAPASNPPPPQPSPPPSPPPRAFTQGVGLLFQWVGVGMFLASFFTCCASGLISRDRATQSDLMRIGWGAYTAQRATAIALPCAVFFGMALAGLGLGLQAQDRRAPLMAVVVTAGATMFWLFHTIFFATVAMWVTMLICAAMTLLFALLLVFATVARRDMLRNPPPEDIGILPGDYKVPYSHMHQDPPEVRLERELEQRRQRLAVQQKELEMLEEKLKRKLQQSDE